jgi:uncharacterized membrane protein SpoIIM required for sporulation
MTLERFLAERSGSWAELQALVDRSHGRADRLTPQEMRQLGLLYRRAAADLSVARRRYPGSPGTGRLETLVSAAHGLVYGKPRRDDRISTFFTRRFWVRVREGGRCLALSVLILVAGTVLGFVWSIVDPVTASGILPAGFHATTHPGQGGVLGIAIPARAGLAFQIFTNNIEVSVLALAGGFTLGLLTAYVLFSNGMVLGVLAGLEWKIGAWEAFTRLIVPHGLLELSCIAVAGSAGFQITRALVDPGRETRSASLRSIAPRLADTVLGIAACLVVAGLTEGIVTAWDLPISAALAVGLFWGGAFWTLVIWRGRPPPNPEAADITFDPTPKAALVSST